MGFFDLFKGGAPASAAVAAADIPCPVCEKPAAPAPSRPAACALCGAAGPVGRACAAGHAVCAACDDGPAARLVERACAAAADRDPVALATRLLEQPALVREKGVPHLLVPAVLAATFANAAGQAREARAARVALACRRAEALPDDALRVERGSGAAAGAGAFAALAGGEDKGRALETRALALIGAEPRRCSKRDALLSILAATRFAREELAADVPAQGIGCETSGRSRECKGAGCPFNR